MSKALRIVRVPNSTSIKVEWEGGGEVPAELQGRYTTPTFAKQAVEAYEAKAKRKITVIDKTLEDPDAENAPGLKMITKQKSRRDFHPLG